MKECDGPNLERLFDLGSSQLFSSGQENFLFGHHRGETSPEKMYNFSMLQSKSGQD